MAVGGAVHVTVARHLREDGRARDCGASRVAAHDGALFVADVANAKAVDEAKRVLARDALERCPQRFEVGSVQPARVDTAHAPDYDRRLGGGAQDERVELLAPLLGVLLRVVETRERTPLRQRQLLDVEQNRRCDKWPSERPAAGLVRSGYEAPAERPVERKQAPAGARRLLLRGSRSGRAASR
jgi:hypothetical protein